MRKKWIVIGGVGLILFSISLFFLSFGSPFSKDDEVLALKIVIDDDDVRVGEDVNFTVEGIDPEEDLVWVLGDGNISKGMKVNHTFQSSNYFNITVSWKDSDRIKGSGNITIPVKCRDVIFLGEG